LTKPRYDHRIATKGQPAPIQVGTRWVVQRTHSWMNGYGKLLRSTDKRRVIVEFFLFLAAAITVLRRLINTARTHLPLGWHAHHPQAQMNQLPVGLRPGRSWVKGPPGRKGHGRHRTYAFTTRAQRDVSAMRQPVAKVDGWLGVNCRTEPMTGLLLT